MDKQLGVLSTTPSVCPGPAALLNPMASFVDLPDEVLELILVDRLEGTEDRSVPAGRAGN